MRDPLTAHPHEPDVSTLLRVCDAHGVPLATNIATAEAVLHLIFEHPEALDGHHVAAQYLEEIAKVRQRGYSLDFEEYHMGVRGIAALIFAKGYPVTSICILGFTGSMTEDKLNDMAKHLINTAKEISERLSQ